MVVVTVMVSGDGRVSGVNIGEVVAWELLVCLVVEVVVVSGSGGDDCWSLEM